MFDKMCSTREIGSVEELKDSLESVPVKLRVHLLDEIRAVLIELARERQYLAQLAS